MTLGTRHRPRDVSSLAGTETAALAAAVRSAAPAIGQRHRELGELRAAWATTNARFLRFEGVHANDVVVKMPISGDLSTVRREFHALLGLRRVMGGSEVGVPTAVGFLAAPAALLTEWIPGSDLDRNLRLSASSIATRQHVRMCGRALAYFHEHGASLTPSAGASHSSAPEEPARHPSSSVAAVESLHAGTEFRVLSAEDFAPNNIRVADSGELWWLDPPTRARFVRPEEDVAHFLTLMVRMAFRDWWSDRKHGRRSDVSPSITAELVDEFLVGYRTVAQFVLDGGCLRSSVKVRLVRLVRKDVRRGHPVRALRTGTYLAGIHCGIGTVTRAHSLGRAAQSKPRIGA